MGATVKLLPNGLFASAKAALNRHFSPNVQTFSHFGTDDLRDWITFCSRTVVPTVRFILRLRRQREALKPFTDVFRSDFAYELFAESGFEFVERFIQRFRVPVAYLIL